MSHSFWPSISYSLSRVIHGASALLLWDFGSGRGVRCASGSSISFLSMNMDLSKGTSGTLISRKEVYAEFSHIIRSVSAYARPFWIAQVAKVHLYVLSETVWIWHLLLFSYYKHNDKDFSCKNNMTQLCFLGSKRKNEPQQPHCPIFLNQDINNKCILYNLWV